ncbi:MAG: DUF72 domain-containing protein [Chitinivibrionales bacterium]|nr:DUF72 domain-containing protein [Chitinivibrionales bacterium]MBD3397320.1 DUF72 domain-containing protein [Chitinivibrionales bacterium]
MKSRVLLGTSGYSYKDWVGPVYPEGTAGKDYLKHYAALFSFTELNFTYYRQPDPRTLDRMVTVTNDRFRFAIKAHQSMTHEITGNFKSDAAAFKQGIAPLIEASKLAAILVQFPFSYHYNPQSRKHLQMLCDEFAGMPLAVEFRNSEWARDSLYEGLKKRGAAFVNVDEPPLSGLIKPSAIVTSHIAYARFHGRNSANWWKGDNASRYDYLYNDMEMSEWIPRIKTMAQQAGVVMVAFNNHWRGQAVKNARRLRELMGAQNE